jgi:hypothetical protein
MFEKLPNLRDDNRLPSVFFAGESITNTNNSVNIHKKSKFLCKIHQAVQTPLWLIPWGVFDTLVCLSPEFFCCIFVNLFWCLFKLCTPRSQFPAAFITGVSRFPNLFTTWSRDSLGSWDPRVFMIGASFWTLGSRFTKFKEHTTIFTGSVILEIDWRLLYYPGT